MPSDRLGDDWPRDYDEIEAFLDIFAYADSDMDKDEIWARWEARRQEMRA